MAVFQLPRVVYNVYNITYLKLHIQSCVKIITTFITHIKTAQ